MYRVAEWLFQPSDNQCIELPEKCCKRLSGSCRRKDERVLSYRDCRPALSLRVTGFAQRIGKPLSDYRVKAAHHQRIRLSFTAPHSSTFPIHGRFWNVSSLISLEYLRSSMNIESIAWPTTGSS